MSETVRSYGYIAVLLDTVSGEAREELQDKLWGEKSDLRVNYEGTLLYSDANANKSYRERENIEGLFISSEATCGSMTNFFEAANAIGHEVEHATAKPYNCIWYNGADNPVDELTKVEFLSGKERCA